jgi:hypothetical protein
MFLGFGGKMKIVSVTVLKWDEYNPRKDLKHPTWFRVDASIVMNRKLHKLNGEQRWFWVFLCALACPLKGGPVAYDLDFWADQSKCSPEGITKALEILEANGTLSIEREQPRTDPNESAHTRTDLALTNGTNGTGRTNERTEEDPPKPKLERDPEPERGPLPLFFDEDYLKDLSESGKRKLIENFGLELITAEIEKINLAWAFELEGNRNPNEFAVYLRRWLENAKANPRAGPKVGERVDYSKYAKTKKGVA